MQHSQQYESNTVTNDIIVFIGGFGSGKTENALSMAMNKANAGIKTALIDMDVINPMFKSTFQESWLRRNGVELISPETSRANTESPSVTAQVRTAFNGGYDCCVFDVGGDSIGSTVLGQFHDGFEANAANSEILFVVNVRRPATDTVEHITGLISRITDSSRLRVTGLVNNTNLSTESTPELLLEGNGILRRVSDKTGIPIAYYSAAKPILNALESMYPNTIEGRPLCLDLVTKPDWLTFYCAKEERRMRGGIRNGEVHS